MTLIRLGRLAVLLLLGSGWGLLPRHEHQPMADKPSLVLTQAWQ